MTAPALHGRLLGGAYRIGALIGQGAMGAVYEATLERLGRPVAVKLLLGSQGPLPPEQVQRFEREARAAAALGHPNIVQVTDFQWLPGEPPVLVMERLAGESLGKTLERVGALPPELGCFLAAQVLDALSAAHQAGIVHRDVKPDNICLVPMGAGVYLAKVLDFGVAKLTGEAPITSRGTMIGTPAYMAPEQATGQPVDPRTDVYAVGATLYHALSGRLPIDPDTPIDQVIERITRVPSPPLATIVPGIDPQLSSVVARAMAKDPHQRFPTAQAFRAALAPFVHGAPSLPSAAAPSHLARSVGGPGTGSPYAASAGPPTGPPPGGPPMGGHAGPSPITAPSPGVLVASPVGGHTGQPPSLPLAGGGAPPSRAGLVIAIVVALVLLVGGAVAVVLYLGLGGDPPASTPAKTAKVAPSTTAAPSATTTPEPAEPVPTATAPGTAPGAPRVTKKDAGAEDASAPVAPPVAPVVDAGAPVATTRTMTRTGANMAPYGTKGMAAIAAVDAALPAFRQCAQTACVRVDKVVRDDPWLVIDVKLSVDASGEARPAGFSAPLPSGPSCPLYEQCLTRKLPSLKLPKADGTGGASFTLLVVERPVK